MKEDIKNNNKPTIVFNNCNNVGDCIDALVKYYTGQVTADFTLSQALEKVKENNNKIEKFKQGLLKED